jgi:5-methylcytosine-specific restriction enzyme subunit McrC
MLCYAWNRLKEKDNIIIDQLEEKEIYNLLTRVLIINLQYLIKRGFYREYEKIHEETPSLKGKIDFNKSLKTFSFRRGNMYCDYEEMSHNTLHNIIIKTTLNSLIKYNALDRDLKTKLQGIIHYFSDISVIKLEKAHFSQIRLHKNNIYYGFILDICQLIFDNLLLNDENGELLFKDFERDDKAMAYLFENFVRNFYRRECPNYKVYRENINWAAEDDFISFLPLMQTDISLESSERKIIIDTKYYKNALINNFGSEKLISSNLYQLFAYLKNNEAKSKKDQEALGILIYPRVTKDLDLKYSIHGHEVRVCTVDLNKDWSIIHSRLLEIIK